MPIVDKSTGQPVQVKYEALDTKTVESYCNMLQVLYVAFLNQISVFHGRTYDFKPSIDYTALVEVVNRVDKRKEHARIFHNIDNSIEYRTIALYCYWIVKLRPFGLAGERTLRADKETSFNPSAINEMFATYLYASIQKLVMRKILKSKNQSDRSPELSKSYLKELLYTFRYRDINKASLIMLFEPQFVDITIAT